METSLHLQLQVQQRPLNLSRKACNNKSRRNPFSCFVPNVTVSQYSVWQREYAQNRISFRIAATSGDFSRRRNRRISNQRNDGSAPKGFMPRTQVGTRNQKKDQRNTAEKGGSSTTQLPGGNARVEDKGIEMNSPSEAEGDSYWKKTVEEEGANVSDEIVEDASNGSTALAYEEVGGTDKNVVELLEKESAYGNEMGISSVVEGSKLLPKKEMASAKEHGNFDGFLQKSADENATCIDFVVEDLNNLPKETASVDEYDNVDDFLQRDETLIEEKTDFEKKLREEEASRLQKEIQVNLRRQEIERLAEKNFLTGNKMFVYPQLVKAEQDIEVFLNRSLSPLNNEPDILIMGAFNDWRWKSFTLRLNKSHLNGDWWSCQIHIPKEAYKMDFVFFNGQSVYDNNEMKDFCIPIEGEMDAFAFDDFLLEEKRRELEELANEKAERRRQEEEQRRIEAEKAAREADRAQAKGEVQKRKETLQQILKKAVRSVDNVWYIEPSEFNCGNSVRFYYNRSSGPLAHATELWIHGGHNNWKDGLTIVERLVRCETKDGDWWYANVVVPNQALVLDWVFANGPPQKANVYDNNHLQDYHAVVTKNIPGEAYWVEEEHQIFQKLQEERKMREEAIRAKAERTVRMKAEMKERTLKSFLLSQKHIVYTEPLDVKAGSTVTVFYNPTNTVLNGKPEVWLRCSFNRWTHRMGPLRPQKMFPANDGSHLKATVKVPLDAYMMDFVFSECEDGGVFDNNYGMDYHLPVFGGVAKEPPMHIVHIAIEMAPIAKVGGLGDVVTSLSRAVQDYNHNVDIVLPKYDCMNINHVKDLQFHKSYGWGGTEIKVWHGKVEGLSVYFLEPQNGFFWRGCIYGCSNDAERFGFFCHAALEFLVQNGMLPDIIHCHDWSSAPVAWLFKEQYMQSLNSARVVFTIHNLEFGQHFIGKALTFSDKATTVSPTYSKEVSGSPVISPNLYKFHGILNGIDPDIWDPYNDKFIPVCS